MKPGFQVIVEAPGPHGETWIQMGLPGGGTTISVAGFYAIICATPNIEAKISGLESKGIEGGRLDETPGGMFAGLKDVDGNNLCLHQKVI